MNTDILDYGATCDGAVCTSAIQAAIDACAASGGGRVTVPAGTYISGTLWLRSNVELHLEHGATLKASENMDDYNELDAYEQNFSCTEEKWVGKHLIIALECENVALTGSGVIDGSADAFFGEFAPNSKSVYVWRDGYRDPKDLEKLRPGQLVCFVECRRVLVENVTLRNHPCWGCFLYGCDYVTVRGMQTRNDKTYFNSDGIDIDSCSYVTVSDCNIETGDDAIAIRGAGSYLKNKSHPCEFVTITNCILSSQSHTIRIGVGEGLIRHIRLSNIMIRSGAPAIGIMSSYHGKGCVSIEDVSFTNITAVCTARVLTLLESANASIKNILLENILAETTGNFNLCSDFPESIQGVTMRNFDVSLKDCPELVTEKDHRLHGSAWFCAKNINGLKIENFVLHDPQDQLKKWKDGGFSFEDCSDRKLIDVLVTK